MENKNQALHPQSSTQSEPIDYIHFDLAVNMIQNYKQKQHRAITDVGIIDDDARAVHFSLAKLKEFIKNLEDASSACQKNLGELGIRFYYATYPEDLQAYPQTAQVNPEYCNRHTLVMIPTYTKDGENVDFCPGLTEAGTCVPIALYPNSDNIPNELHALMNQGDLRPPPPDSPARDAVFLNY